MAKKNRINHCDKPEERENLFLSLVGELIVTNKFRTILDEKKQGEYKPPFFEFER